MIRTWLGRVIKWATPQELWCPCLQCVLERVHESGHTEKELEKEVEPEKPSGIRPARAYGSMYLRVKEH